jgi:hypothetical protein
MFSNKHVRINFLNQNQLGGESLFLDGSECFFEGGEREGRALATN